MTIGFFREADRRGPSKAWVAHADCGASCYTFDNNSVGELAGFAESDMGIVRKTIDNTNEKPRHGTQTIHIVLMAEAMIWMASSLRIKGRSFIMLKSIDVEDPGNLRSGRFALALNTVPATASPIVAPVKRTKKNALVPAATSCDSNVLRNTWYGGWKSMPIPTPEIRGNSICKYIGAFSSIRVNNPKPKVEMRRPIEITCF